MINNVILVGRLTKDPEIRELQDGRNVTDITLAVQRPFKNAQTLEYDTDFIKCTLWDSLALNTCEYCKKGTTIGVKGRVSTRNNQIEIVAEKITFISKKD